MSETTNTGDQCNCDEVACPAPTLTFTETCEQLRGDLRPYDTILRDLKNSVLNMDQSDFVDKGEVLANLTLSLRCVEEAIMRLGKVLQWTEGRTELNPKTGE